jgi:hypothetical protein
MAQWGAEVAIFCAILQLRLCGGTRRFVAFDSELAKRLATRAGQAAGRETDRRREIALFP